MLSFLALSGAKEWRNVTVFPACRGAGGVSQFTVIKQFLVDFVSSEMRKQYGTFTM